MQVNSGNLPGLGITISDAFDACHSLTAGARVLAASYSAPAPGADNQPALVQALSRYNTGTPNRGVANGYVQRVQASAEVVVPALRLRTDATGHKPLPSVVWHPSYPSRCPRCRHPGTCMAGCKRAVVNRVWSFSAHPRRRLCRSSRSPIPPLRCCCQHRRHRVRCSPGHRHNRRRIMCAETAPVVRRNELAGALGRPRHCAPVSPLHCAKGRPARSPGRALLTSSIKGLQYA